MAVTVKKTGDSLTFNLSPQAVEELALKDGSAVTIEPKHEAQAPSIRYASVEEVMKAHREMEPHHAEAYRELAK